ncbi:hypothetical protein FGIG_00246 [Fasciola gigantica]|uniref:Uncharacterized protein n=1 Tax=Fasciola gigantica TaxID=46835 RepID=A0A504Z8K1_FASGI|nr:hypothetical protein FGIG_00246 [Fasciola gigantica]
MTVMKQKHIFSGLTITPSEVKQMLHSLDRLTAAEPAGNNPAILQPIAEVAATYPAAFLNLSVEEEKVPEDWRVTLVVPGQKTRRRYLTSNYSLVVNERHGGKLGDGVSRHKRGVGLSEMAQ